MPDFLKLVSLLREQMTATLSRSDVLRPLAWLIGMEALALVSMLFAKAPLDVVQPTLYVLVGTIAIYIAIYIVCFFIDRDALRSEKYSLQKYAIEHGLLGDSKTGLFDAATEKEQPGQLLVEQPKQIEN